MPAFSVYLLASLFNYYFKLFITLAGTPAANTLKGILLVTILPAAIIELSPIVTPLRIIL